MPIGQAHTTWFPKVKEVLQAKWNSNLTIIEHFKLVEDLNNCLDKIRADGSIEPPIIWCPTCKTKHPGVFTKISITAMYFALEKQGLCDHEEFLSLKREWNKYSKAKGINIYGNENEKTTKTQQII